MSSGHAIEVPSHRSVTSHSFPAARQTAVLFASGGQAAPGPVQRSARSQTPAAARHCIVAGLKASLGQSSCVPSQLSATSHTPAAGRQTAVLFASAGQLALDPVQLSARSQTPAAARHVAPAATKPSAGQVLPTPSQLSATSQMPADGRQTAVLFASAGQVPLEPVQVSCRSQTPAAARQSVPAASNWQLEEQQSPFARFPSSHCSAASTVPSPHTPAGKVTMAAAQLWLLGALDPSAR